MRPVWLLGMAVAGASCNDSWVPSPFGGNEVVDSGLGDATVGADAGAESPVPGAVGPNEVLGGPCNDDAQCDDAIDCTFGVCDPELQLCRFTADDTRCADDNFCNGVEECHPSLGCRDGAPTSCSDSTPCTIDICDEATRSCRHVGRDFDGDGDIDGNCAAGTDCDDLDPLVSSAGPELCNNGLDDDCDGELDEGECRTPQYDTCADALTITAAGSYLLSSAGANLDYGASCAPESAAARELVLAVTVPSDRDVDLVARAGLGGLSFARVASCGDAASELECVAGTRLPISPSAARLRLRASGGALQTVYLTTDASTDIQLDVTDDAPTAVPSHRSCELRVPLVAEQPVDVDVAFDGSVAESRCPTDRGDLFYEFTIDETSDIVAFAEAGEEGLGQPRLSLRTPSCGPLEAELGCSLSQARLAARALSPGSYILAASATGPLRYSLSLDVSPPSPPPPTERCAGAPPVTLGGTETQSFEEHVDDIAAGCTPGLIDAARQVVLDTTSDVLVVARFSNIDRGAVALSAPACRLQDTRICAPSNGALARVSQRALPPGEYRVVIESQLGLPATVTTLVRPATPPTLVAASENCATALSIGAEGGFFQGNTANALHDYTASCDFATPSGAPDQLLRFEIETPRRVVFDMRGSDFETLLSLRRGPDCPGEEVTGGCVVMGGGDRSFLDLSLPAGEYFVQVDGYAGASGTWFLDVFTLDP